MSEMMHEEVMKACEALKKGGVILYPTDTVWGLGCDATRVKAVERIYRMKKRPESKSLIILLDQLEKLYQFVEDVPATAIDLINSVETPLTIIYPNARNLARNLIAADGTVAIRIVRDEFCSRLIGLLNRPLVSTSANLSGESNPLIFTQISKDILDQVDYAVNLNRTRIRQVKPSTIIRLRENGEFEMIRN